MIKLVKLDFFPGFSGNLKRRVRTAAQKIQAASYYLLKIRARLNTRILMPPNILIF